jgi:hypothetical protein
MLISVSCECGQKWSFKASMAGRSFPCRTCGKLVSIGTPSADPGSLQPKQQSPPAAAAGKSPIAVRQASKEKRGTAAAAPLQAATSPATANTAAAVLPASDHHSSTGRNKTLLPRGNRVVVAAATCIGLAIATATWLVYQNESRRALKSSAEIWKQANNLLDEGNVSAADTLLKQYVASWQAPNRDNASKLLNQIALATSDDAVKQKLAALNDQQFEQSVANKSLPDNDVSHPVLVRVLADSIAKNTDAATQWRAEIKARQAEEEAVAAALREKERMAQEEAAREQREAEKKIAGGASKVQRYLGLNQAERKTLADKITAIETALRLSDLSSRTVFQQQVGRIDACIEMTSLVALSLGATPENVEQISSRQALADITADNVYQQLAGHLSIYIEMMQLAAVSAGAPVEKCSSIRSALSLEDTLARTVLQQVSSRIGGVSAIATLLAEALGADSEKLATLNATIRAGERTAPTVFQEMVSRQSGMVYVLATAAIAQGAPAETLDAVEADARSDDLLTDTAQQQLAARLERTFEATTLLAKAIVEK